MQGFFDVFPALSYWITASVWAIIVVVLLAKLRAAPRQHTAVTTLVLVLTLDAFRTLIESLYFGVYWSAVFGVFPAGWRDQLQNPIYVGVLKLVTVGTGLVVLVILLRRWLPADAHMRELAAQSLQQSRLRTARAESKHRRIVEMSLDVICTIDAEGRFVDLSPRCRDIWGYTPEEMIGKKFLDFVHPDDREGSEAEAAAIHAGTATDSFENRYVRKDGRVVYMMWSAVWSPPDQLFYSVARDVSRRRELEIKRRELEERLQQSQRLESVGQLTGGVAHDFNNLLTVILGNAKLLEEKLANDADLRRIVETTHVAAQRGAELTQRLLAFSRRQALEPQTIDVNKLVAGVELLLRRLIGEHIDIRLELDSEMWGIFADPLQLESALINLGVNARDAMPAGGRLTIRTYRCGVGAGQTQLTCDGEMGPGEYAAIVVLDDGAGMSAETRDKAFEPFFTTKGLGKGSGLGLSMVYGFVKQSGGHVLLESAPGQGTAVTLFFPRDERAAIGSAAPPAAASAALNGHETVLIAEDNDLVRTYTAELLRKLGYQVLEAGSGAEAMALLERHPAVDLLFTDMMMPGGMTGIDLARRARDLRPDLKTLLTSGYVESAASSGATAEGMRILRKPYQGQELAKALREILGS